ncbi:MAG: polymer-forming cytoskeletal protein [Burkholderiaceae bacterium]
MAIQSPFFGKRDVEPTGLRHNVPSPVLQPHGPAVDHAVHPVPPAPAPARAAISPAAPTANGVPREGGSKLTVGPNIKLKGVEITDCDTLVVEGTVEATMDSRLMQIAECGAFKGSADIDIAEIHGAFDGTLTVRQKLVIYSTGTVTGKIRYGKLVVEEGGQLTGEVGVGPVAKPLVVAKAALQAA